MSSSTFEDFGLAPGLLDAVSDLGFEEPTPIQSEAIPVLLAGNDVIGGARTGSGKTAAFGLPLLHAVREGGPVRALILAPTRELALQVSDALASFARKLDIDVLTIYGGAAYKPQLRGLQRGCTVVVGTPGRVIDLMERGSLVLDAVEYFVLDEADEMLRMGFVEDVEHVLAALPEKRQIAMFSATMPEPIRRLAQTYLNNPVEVQVEEEALTVDHIDQAFIRVSQRDKSSALIRLLAARPPGATLVFARTRNRCAEVAEHLISQGISADALHGDLNQGARERVLSRLRSRSLDVVVATDVAARGIDVDHLSCVVNFDIPDDAEIYVHRIGRTGRAGRQGTAITFVSPRDRGKAKYIQRTLGIQIENSSLPTDAQIEAARAKELLEYAGELMDQTTDTETDALLASLKKRGWSVDTFAATLYRLLGEERNFNFEAAPIEEERDFSSINESEIIIGAGRRDGLRPADIVGTLANDLNIPASQIGKISLGSNRAFVGMPTDVAKALLDAHKTLEIRGRAVAVSWNSSSSNTQPTTRAESPKATDTASDAGQSPADKKSRKRVTTGSKTRSKRGRKDKNKGKPGRHNKRKGKKQR